MSGERYPADLAVTAEHFANSGWKAAIESANREGYSAMSSALSSAGREAMDADEPAKGKVLGLLGDICSMMLTPASPNEPYRPGCQMFSDGQVKRSLIPDDLTEEDLTFFSEIVEDIDDVRLQARLADVIWLVRKKRDVKYALIAIDAYRRLPLDHDTWHRDGRDCWNRAIRLALMLGEGAGDRLKEMLDSVTKAFDAAGLDDKFFALRLSELLKENRLGGPQAKKIAEHLEELAKQFDGVGDIYLARGYLKAAADWFGVADDDAKQAEMTVAEAETWVSEAEARLASNDPSHMVAASFYENAIQTYRTIPRAERSVHGVDERIDELRHRLSDAGERSLGELQLITSEGIDISDLIQRARRMVRGKEPLEAIKAFANVYTGADAEQLREHVEENIQASPLWYLVDMTMRSADGRVIAKRPGLGIGDTAADRDDLVMRSQMLQQYQHVIGIAVQGDILPALEVLMQEHRLREEDFVGLCRESPIVPKDRAFLFGKALFAGYDQDIVTAIHLLAPQMENLVRVHLKAAGLKTTNLDLNGIENESGLSALMEAPEAEKVFGKNLAFEIRALYCDPMGPNLRNAVAHGLINDDGRQSLYALYAWWHGLRIVFNTYWNAAHKNDADQSPEGSS